MLECSSLIPQFNHSVNNLNDFLNRQLDISYKYLLLSTQFSSYIKNRPGFQSKFRGLSDRSWEKGIELIKYVTKRGGKVKFNAVEDLEKATLELNELEAMAVTLDTEKMLFEKARAIHERSSHAHNSKTYDPEVAHYIEEEHLEDLAGSVRDYAGYANDLKNLYRGSNDINLDTYLFDQYLQKA